MCMGQVLQIAAPSDQRSGVLNMHEDCYAACSRYFGHEGGYTEPSPP